MMKLSQAIRNGGYGRPHERFTLKNDSTGGGCAIGGALDICGFEIPKKYHERANSVISANLCIRHWPIGQHVVNFSRVADRIIYMNDCGTYTRDQIADWIETVEQDMESRGLDSITGLPKVDITVPARKVGSVAVADADSKLGSNKLADSQTKEVVL